MAKVTGLGGVFFKCKDKENMLNWYCTHLGIEAEDWGAVFQLDQTLKLHPGAYNVWSLAKVESKYFEPSQSSFMINYTVDHLHELLAQLKAAGVTVIDKTEESEFGKFGWVLDPEGNKIELWQPPEQK